MLQPLTTARPRTFRPIASTVAATLLILAAGLGAWRLFSEWRLGRIALTNDGPPLIVQVYPEAGDEPIGAPIDLLKQTTLALPDGDYRLRVDGLGRLGRTYRMAVNRGETIAHALSLDEGRLLGREWMLMHWGGINDSPREEPMPFALVTRAVELTPGKSDIVEFDGKTLIRRDGVTGQPVWDAANPRVARPAGRDPAPWLRGIGPNRWGFEIVDPPADLDGDGARDLLIVLANSAAFLALSGKDGSMLWNHAAQHDGSGGPQPEGPTLPGPLPQPSRQAWLAGRPAIGDLDGDGAPDLVATMLFQEFPAETERRTGRRWGPMIMAFSRRTVQAISGRTGRLLWAHPLDPTFTGITRHQWQQGPATLLRGRKSIVVGVFDGSRWLPLDPATGRLRDLGIDLGVEPVRPLQYADLDGDGEPEVLVLGPGPTAQQRTLIAFSTATGQQRWTSTINAKHGTAFVGIPPEKWPWLVDPDGDGRAEVIVPDSGPMPPSARFRGVRMLDGSTGQARWVRPMQPETKAEDGLAHLVEAPDLDGDGTRDLIGVSRFEGRDPPAPGTLAAWRDRRPEPPRIYVDALSGRDGHPLWSWHEDVPSNKVTYAWPPRWCGRGPDGRPMLAVPLGGQNPDQPGGRADSSSFLPPAVHLLEATTGRETNRALGLQQVGVADLDGDGLDDLWGEADGQLRAFRGDPPEAWRALGSFQPAWRPDLRGQGSLSRIAADLDGDGVGDTLGDRLHAPGDSANDPTGSRTATARSGRDGRLLWKTPLDLPWPWFLPEHQRGYSLSAFPPPAGDLDGDGTPDVIVQKATQDAAEIGRQPATLPIQVLSGRDGRRLWSAGPLPLGFEAHGYSQIQWVEPQIIEEGTPPDLVVGHCNPFLAANPRPTIPNTWGVGQERLARVSGRTGRIVWDIALREQPTSWQPGRAWPAHPRIADLDGDGRLDAAMTVRLPGQTGGTDDSELKAVSLADGKILWTHPFRFEGRTSGPPQVEIGHGRAGKPATIFVAETPAHGDAHELIVQGIDGRDGSLRWTWRSGVGQVTGQFWGGVDPIALDGDKKDALCVNYSNTQRESQLVILDARGRERGRRSFPPEPGPRPYLPPVQDMMIDLDGDGRDEMLVWYDGVLRAWDRGMTRELWTRPAQGWPITGLAPASPGRHRTLIVHPATAIDGATGQVLWTDRAPPPRAAVLDPGDAGRRPRLLTFSWAPPAVTTCRFVQSAPSEGGSRPPDAGRVPPGLARDDPRWTRPLPWTGPILRTIGPRRFLAMAGLALVGAVLPLGILLLAARRRPWTVRLLMALPIAAAVPLTVLQTIEPMLPAELGTRPVSSHVVFAIATLAGLPIVAFAGAIAWSLARRRWRSIAGLIGVTVAASAIIGAAWIWSDSRAMPAIERHDRAHWYLAAVPGAYATGAMMLVGWPLRAAYRLIRPRQG